MRVALETEEMARNTMEMLHAQRQQIEGMNTKVRNIYKIIFFFYYYLFAYISEG